jgi:hypothetical protein
MYNGIMHMPLEQKKTMESGLYGIFYLKYFVNCWFDQG